jgi:hypothetical protein
LLALEADVFEIARVPQGIEVTLQGGSVIDIARAGENPGLNGFGWNTPLPVNSNFDNHILLAQTSRTQPQETE